MWYNVHQKLLDNIQAIQVALEWKGQEKLSGPQVEALKKYAGFGGIKAMLYPDANREDWIRLGASQDDLRVHQHVIELHQLLQQHFNQREYKQVIDSIKNS